MMPAILAGLPDALQALEAIYPPERRLTHREASDWLYARAREAGPGGLCVDVGAWCGWTTCVMALAGPAVLAVDTFRASDRWVHQDALLARLGGKREGTLDCYARLVAGAGLGGRIAAVQARSLEAAQAMGEETADLVWLDADHSRAAVAADIVAWHAVVRRGGILCGDNWRIGEVREPVLAVLAGLGWPAPQEGPHEVWWVRRP